MLHRFQSTTHFGFLPIHALIITLHKSGQVDTIGFCLVWLSIWLVPLPLHYNVMCCNVLHALYDINGSSRKTKRVKNVLKYHMLCWKTSSELVRILAPRGAGGRPLVLFSLLRNIATDVRDRLRKPRILSVKLTQKASNLITDCRTFLKTNGFVQGLC